MWSLSSLIAEQNAKHYTSEEEIEAEPDTDEQVTRKRRALAEITEESEAEEEEEENEVEGEQELELIKKEAKYLEAQCEFLLSRRLGKAQRAKKTLKRVLNSTGPNKFQPLNNSELRNMVSYNQNYLENLRSMLAQAPANDVVRARVLRDGCLTDFTDFYAMKSRSAYL